MGDKYISEIYRKNYCSTIGTNENVISRKYIFFKFYFLQFQKIFYEHFITAGNFMVICQKKYVLATSSN